MGKTICAITLALSTLGFASCAHVKDRHAGLDYMFMASDGSPAPIRVARNQNVNGLLPGVLKLKGKTIDMCTHYIDINNNGKLDPDDPVVAYWDCETGPRYLIYGSPPGVEIKVSPRRRD